MLALIIASCLLGADDPPTAEQDFEVEITSLLVQRRPKGVELERRFFRKLPGGFNAEDCGGTVVVLRMRTATHSILGLDTFGSTLLEFSDDQGNDLPPALEDGISEHDEGRNSTPFAKSIRVGSFSLPTRGANKLRVRADVSIFCGHQTEMIRTAVFKLKEQEKVVVGSGIWEVTKVSDASQDKVNPMPGTRIHLKLDVESKSVQDIVFTKPDGQKIADTKPFKHVRDFNATARDGNGGVLEVDSKEVASRCMVLIPPGIDHAIMEIRRYVDFEAVMVPIDLDVQMGL